MAFPGLNELTSGLYATSLADESDQVVDGHILSTLTLTLYEEVTEKEQGLLAAIINNRNNQNVLGVNGVSFTTAINIAAITAGGPGTGSVVTITTSAPHGLGNKDIVGNRQSIWLSVTDTIPIVATRAIITVVDAVTLTVPLLTLKMSGLNGSILPLPNLRWAIAPADNTIIRDDKPIETHIALFQATWAGGAKALRHEVSLQVSNLATVA